jgi:Gpi18-like mannosyltransferase
MLHRSPIFYPLCALLVALAVALRWVGLPFQTHDMQDDLLHWFDYIVTHGRFAALSDKFYNYTPPYIYLMIAVSYLDGVIDRVTLIKSITVLFDGIAAFLVFKIAMLARPDVRRSIFLALLFLNLPTVILNGSWWGQFDVSYTAFLLAFLYFMIRDRPFLATAMFGVALSVKLQAIFLAPLLVYLFASGAIPALAILIVPLVYVLLMVPAALAGRGWLDLLTLYGDQVDIPHRLSARAPNIYVVIQHFLSPNYYPQATIVGVLLAGIVSLIVLRTHFLVRRPPPVLFLVVAAAFWLVLEPSLLPKMHERYFLMGDVFAFVMAIFVPRAWWTVALLQLGSILGYSYFMAIDKNLPIDFHAAALIGAFAEIPAMIGIGWYYWKALKNPLVYPAAA